MPHESQLFHGTTYRFDKFDAKRGNDQNHSGVGVYLTNCERDATFNYVGQGADLRIRIDDRAYQIQNENPGVWKWSEAKKMAIDELDGKQRLLLRCEIKDEAKLMPLGDHYLEMWSYDPEDEDAEPELSDIAEALVKVCDDTGYSIEITDAEMKTVDIHRMFRNQWGDNDVKPGEAFRMFVQACGFDGVEYEDAWNFFPGMVTKGTKHWVIYNDDMVLIKDAQVIENAA